MCLFMYISVFIIVGNCHCNIEVAFKSPTHKIRKHTSFKENPRLTGLIIDAFGELRDQLESVKENLESNCFICGIGNDYFDAVPHGFDMHTQKEHNLANYM